MYICIYVVDECCWRVFTVRVFVFVYVFGLCMWCGVDVVFGFLLLLL